MKYMLLAFFCTLGLCAALPAQPAQSSVLDLLKDLENVVEEDGTLLITNLVSVIHHIEDTLNHLKELVPQMNERIQEILDGLKKVTAEVRELLGKKNVYYGFDLLGSLNELSGGVKLQTAMEVLSLAAKAHKVMEDAKEFVPHLETTLEKMKIRVKTHANDFVTKVLKDLGLQDDVAQSVMKKIEDLFEKVEAEGHALILDLLHKMEQTFDLLEEKLPEEYKRVQKAVEEIREQIHELVVEIQKSLVMRSFSIFDIGTDVSDGTDLGTAFKIMSLISKFNTVVQDVRNFEPRAEVLLQHSVKKVATSAQVFFNHAANKLFITV